MLNPRESGKYIAKLAKYVTIKQSGIEKLGNELIKQINSNQLSTENFSQNAVHPKKTDAWALDWLFVVDSLNFCFWTPDDQHWRVNHQTGYFALCAAINRAMEANVDILNPNFYSNITEEQLFKILKSDSKVEIPLLKERVKSLHEVGAALLKEFNGSFKEVVKQANNSAVNLLNLIVKHFPCFRDEAIYADQKVAIYKRAQILVGDIWACFQNEGLGHFEDIEELTMFADYRVPQSLLYFDVFEYNDELLQVLNANTILKNGHEMEVEIRGCSIHAVELVRNFAADKLGEGKKINSVLIDHFLWDFRRKHAKEISKKKLPFHKTICIYY